METTHGTWGNRTKIYQDDKCLVTFLDLVPNQRCSWHWHDKMYNQFYCVSGVLGVRTDKGYTTEITSGQGFTVEPGVKHEFQTYTHHTQVIEIAYVEFDGNDIHRERLGGAIKEDK